MSNTQLDTNYLFKEFEEKVKEYNITLTDHFEGSGEIERVIGGDAIFIEGFGGAVLTEDGEVYHSNDSPELKSAVKAAYDKNNDIAGKEQKLAAITSPSTAITSQPAANTDLSSRVEKDCLIFKDSIKGKALNTADNLELLGQYYGMKFCFNLMNFEIDICNLEGGSFASSVDEIRSLLISKASIHQLPKAVIDDHLIAVCQKNKYHPVKDYLDDGEWDYAERVETVIDCINAKHKEIARIVLKRWLVGAIASLYEDSFKSKLVPVMQGDQSFKKTAFVERIAQLIPAAFLEGAELNPDNKDSVLTCSRHWIVELGELERTSKNSQGSLKAFITKKEDTLRPPYGRGDIRKPRQTAFIATVNGSEFLKDETGSSRFAVVEMAGAADMEKLNDLLGWHYDGTGSIKQPYPELLRQFWLEVKTMYDNGEPWQLDEAETQTLRKINSGFNDNGPWYDLILDGHINGECVFFDQWVTAGDFVKEKENCTGKDTSMIGKAFRRLAADGFLESKKGSGNRTLYRAIRKGQLDIKS